jgi:hypothetical protein
MRLRPSFRDFFAIFALVSTTACAANVEDGSTAGGAAAYDDEQAEATAEVAVAEQRLSAVDPSDVFIGYMPMHTRITLYSPGGGCRVVVEYGNVFAAAYAKAMLPSGSNCNVVTVLLTGRSGNAFPQAATYLLRGNFNVFAQATVPWSNLVGAVFLMREGERDYVWDLSPLRPVP